VLLQVVSVPLDHVLPGIQRLGLFEDFGKLGAGLVKFGIGFGQFVVSLGEALRFRFFTPDFCALTFQIFLEL
jgi:hypothetical protein